MIYGQEEYRLPFEFQMTRTVGSKNELHTEIQKILQVVAETQT